MLVVLRIARPVIGDAGAAGKANNAVADQGLPVGPVVDASNGRETERVVPREMAAARLEDVENLLADARRTHRVEQDLHAYAALRRRGKRLRESESDLAGPVDISLDGDRVLRRVDRLQHRRIETITVVQQLDRVASGERNARGAGHG